MMELFKLLCSAVVGLFRSRASLEAENLALRHQLNMLRRQSPRRLAPGILVGETGFEALLVDFAFCPDEGLGGFVMVGDEILDMGDELWNALERGSVELLSR
jgi:hypothetical protein